LEEGFDSDFLEGKGAFSLHAPPFGFWSMMVNPGFIHTYDSIQEVITLMVEPLQKTTADVLVVAHMYFCQMFGHPPCRNFAEQKNRPYLH
jgi:hypothetical protein